jgi:hypothetical protein
MSRRPQKLVCDALTTALLRSQHADRCLITEAIIEGLPRVLPDEHEMICNMSSMGNRWDNVWAENCSKWSQFTENNSLLGRR